jgi:GNAT superfamily N-acetyltransferase
VPLTIAPVTPADVDELLALMRGYCDFYQVHPSDEALTALTAALLEHPDEGVQLLARDGETPIGFATIYWTWQTLHAARVGVLNDLYVVPSARGTGAGRALIEQSLQACRARGMAKLAWETAPDNAVAQRLYDGLGAEKSSWLSYELDV